MTSVCILILRINTAKKVSAAWRCKASVTADLEHAISEHIEEPDDCRMLNYNFLLRQL